MLKYYQQTSRNIRKGNEVMYHKDACISRNCHSCMDIEHYETKRKKRKQTLRIRNYNALQC